MTKDNRPEKILVIDDSIEHIKILINLLENEYEVYFAKNGAEGLSILATIQPDLILLDIVMPGMDGFEVCRRIKADETSREIPLIFISVYGKDDDETKGLGLGAIDYITKPFNPSIVKARIKNHLKLRATMKELEHLYSLALDASPMTGLPGNNSIAKHIENALDGGDENSVVYTDLDNFKAFNDKYGFARGDEVILFTATALQRALKKAGCPNSFVGHVGGDDFVLVVPSQHTVFVTKEIITYFDDKILNYYNSQDREQKCIKATNRRGEPQIFPVMTISIAVVDLSSRRYSTYIEVNDACVEMKKKAKTTRGSSVCFDQRKQLQNS